MENIKINFLVRVKNKMFWMALVPAVLLLVQMVAALFGWQLDLQDLQGKILAVIDAIFGVFVILGVVVDPTTAGFGDSAQALTYTEPKNDHAQQF